MRSQEPKAEEQQGVMLEIEAWGVQGGAMGTRTFPDPLVLGSPLQLGRE